MVCLKFQLPLLNTCNRLFPHNYSQRDSFTLCLWEAIISRIVTGCKIPLKNRTVNVSSIFYYYICNYLLFCVWCFPEGTWEGEKKKQKGGMVANKVATQWLGQLLGDCMWISFL